MAAAKKDDKATDKPTGEVVVVPFAYATATSGEVVQLVKGDVIVEGRYAEDSLEHLRGIGFIGSEK